MRNYDKSGRESRRRLRRLLLSAAFTAIVPAALAQGVASPMGQRPEGQLSPQAQGFMARAGIMLRNGNPVGSRDQLAQALESPLLTAPQREQLHIEMACAALEAQWPEARWLLESFTRRYPASRYYAPAMRRLADFFFFSGEWGEAALAYSQGNIDGLAGNEKDIYDYRLAICSLKTGKFNAARRLLQRFERGGALAVAARFYIAYTDYLEGDYRRARDGFEAVQHLLPAYEARAARSNPEYEPTDMEAGYYLAQIDFLKGEYASVAERAARLLDRRPDRIYEAELNRLAGESCFKLGDMSRARRYLQAYRSATPDCLPSALYALGSILYSDGDYSRAAECLEGLTDERSLLGQGAALYMGQIEARRHDNARAALYFEKAWRMGLDRKLSEKALYNYVAAITEGGSAPFASSAELMEEFLRAFPESDQAEKVKEYLTVAYYNEHDYTRALQSINRIARPDARALAVKQKVLYELGCSEVANKEYVPAATHLREAVELARCDRNVAQQARLWLGQALYAQGKYKEAAQALHTFIEGDRNGAASPQARYDLGYALYMQDSYAEAYEAFRKALESGRLPVQLATDARVRMADCLYYRKDYAGAARLYAEAEQSVGGDKAYSAMRAAMMHGLNGDHAAKREGLRRTIAAYPDSRWVPSALYELAMTEARLGDTAAAESTLRRLAESYPGMEEGRRGQLHLGLLYAETGRTDEAIEALKATISRWPTSEEARSADTDLRRLMGRRGELAEYARFMNSIPGAPKVNASELEKLQFDAAEDQWVNDNTAIAGLQKYLADYPDGAYQAAALGYLAWSEAEAGKYDEALRTIGTLEARCPHSSQVPEATLLKARILEEHYPARRDEALEAYLRAEELWGASMDADVYGGIMRLSPRPAQKLKYADLLLATPGIGAEERQEAEYYKGEALQALGRGQEAAAIYAALAKDPNSLYGARGAVALGEYRLAAGDLKKAEKELLQFLDGGTPHQYWLARGYITLADVYARQGDKDLAREYLSSLKANYPGKEADIQQMINDRLKALKKK